jgi:hypothetical protein
MTAPSNHDCHALDHRRDRGAILVICLLLLAVAIVFGVSGPMAATLELRMAANTQYRERAFQAAEYAIEEAIRSQGLRLDFTYDSPRVVPAAGDLAPVPGSPPDAYSYRLYVDLADGSAGWPVESVGSGLRAYHFVIEASGYSSRGAADTHVQGMYVVRPMDWTADEAPPGCATGDDECVGLVLPRPERTFWYQQGAD